jgi:hypothetical protein
MSQAGDPPELHRRAVKATMIGEWPLPILAQSGLLDLDHAIGRYVLIMIRIQTLNI